jgi:hypothetical protein
MPTVTLKNAKNLSELAQRIYGLDAADPHVAIAVKALQTANPNLHDKNLSHEPSDTPVIVPVVPGLAFAAGAIPAPRVTDLVTAVSQIPQVVQQMVSEVQSKKQRDPTRATLLKRFDDAQAAMNVKPLAAAKVDAMSKAGLKALKDNVRAFTDTHGNG